MTEPEHHWRGLAGSYRWCSRCGIISYVIYKTKWYRYIGSTCGRKRQPSCVVIEETDAGATEGQRP